MSFDSEDYDAEELKELCVEILKILDGEKACVVIAALHKVTKTILESEIRCR